MQCSTSSVECEFSDASTEVLFKQVLHLLADDAPKASRRVTASHLRPLQSNQVKISLCVLGVVTGGLGGGRGWSAKSPLRNKNNGEPFIEFMMMCSRDRTGR